MRNHVSKAGAAKQVLEYVLNTEPENYREWCEENELDPKAIRGEMQSTHVYALALIGLDMEWEG